MLRECRASVQALRPEPAEHLVELDATKRGPAVMVNELAARATGEWLLPLADDDLVDADYLQLLAPHLDGADVVYGWCRVPGSSWSPNRLYRPGQLRHGNFIPATALVRRSLWGRLGGYRPVPYEDWDLWLRAEEAGARFVCVPEVCWTYRQHDSNLFNTVGRDRR